ncbi:hypothetical protein B738_14522 [Photorhabdus temperata subsp. temperata M1021]|nr:hypothetical protein B738_14522 [Photorhabdus temperata subsp. temperata M1021]
MAHSMVINETSWFAPGAINGDEFPYGKSQRSQTIE